MQPDRTNAPETLALQALAAAMDDQRLADRFLSITGIEAPELKHRAGERWLLAAFLRFLEGHEPDLIAIAARIGAKPAELVAARRALEA